MDLCSRSYVLCVSNTLELAKSDHLNYFLVVFFASFGLRFIMARENARRDSLESQRTLEKEIPAVALEHDEKASHDSVLGDNESFLFEDLTDWEQEKFRYVL